ncbi:MAG: hypothetical protein ACI89X_001377 [Planctomycetota bacterium]|jgi:hypothetical protein
MSVGSVHDETIDPRGQGSVKAVCNLATARHAHVEAFAGLRTASVLANGLRASIY